MIPKNVEITARQLEAAKLWMGAVAGDRRDQLELSEQVAFGDIVSQITPLIKRTLLTNYTQVPSVWDRFSTKHLVDSIDRDEELMTFNMLDQSGIPLENGGNTFVPGALPTIGLEGKYPKIGMTGASRFVRASVFGESFGAQWKTLVNTRGQSVTLFSEAIEAFGQHARGAEDVAATRLLMNNGAINAGTTQNTLGTATGNSGNHLAGDPALKSIFDIQAAVRQAQTFYIDNVNVYFDKFALVLPPAAVSNAKQVLSTKSFQSIGATSARAASYEQTLDLGATIDVVPNRFLSASALGGAAAPTAWFLIPVSGGPKPVLMTTFLRGYETPSYFMKSSNATAIGGGADTNPYDGDFDTDSIDSKVRHVVGAAIGWKEGIIWSAGTGAGLTSAN